MKNSTKKLKINKQTISNLDVAEMNKQVGGAAPTNGRNCRTLVISVCITCGGCYLDQK